tara:strand:+ start:47 stop:331 length:285 start_codon:yes stop_codon:yes gene_type:complete
MSKDMPQGIKNKMKRLEEIAKKTGGQHSSKGSDFDEQQRIRWAAMKEVFDTYVDRGKFKDAMGLVFPRLYMNNKRKTKQNKGGLIDYRKTGMFK